HIERLRPGDDLRRSLEQWAKRQDLGAAFVLSAVGSLSPAMLRLAGRDTPTVIDGDSELLTLSGTISAHGVHLHLSVADAHG
ncbi:DNA-binding protein, partial [Salmonella enterica subsp. enterica serovar Typhimurium]|nr:DNA-binding protein [Salmonella enterica subsp. enterica serovar Typhimurium]